jgi:hypothetical protein
MKLTTAAIMAFEAERGKTLVDLAKGATEGQWVFADIYSLAYHSLREGGRLTSQPFNLSFEDFLDLAEDTSIQEIIAVVVESVIGKVQGNSVSTSNTAGN